MKHKFLHEDDSFDAVGNEIYANFAPWLAGNAGNPSGLLQESAFFNQGSAPTSGASLAGSTIAVTTGGITINLVFDAAAMAAPDSFRAGIVQAATILAQTISDRITVNLAIDYSGTGGGAAAGPDHGLYESYSLVRADLISHATPGDITFNALPSGSSIQGQSNVAVWNAELKLWGLLGANDATTDDGSATFATDINPNLLVGVALHELTHALGRVPYGSAPDVFDLFRFTSPGTYLFSGGIPAPAAYFSIDGGITKLADLGRSSDPSDFLNSGVQGSNDPFNEYYNGSTLQSLTNADLAMLDALGFHIGSGTAPTSLADLTVGGITLNGTRIGFSINNIGSEAAAASTARLYLSTDATITISDRLVGSYPSPSLQAGGTDSESIAWSLPTNLSAGTYHLGVIADATSQVAESNESNNASIAATVMLGNSNRNSLSGTTGNNILFGLAGNDTLSNGGGNNVFVGGAGSDTLIGGTGMDQFVFNARTEGLDQIANFRAGDLIDFAAAGFGNQLGVAGANTGLLDSSHFVANANGPTNTTQEFWFNTSNHTLYFDSNGSAAGGQVAIAHLQNSYVLHSTDILLV